jgi:hypothetical protein
MTNTLLSIFLIIMPGVIATEIGYLNSKTTRKLNGTYIVSVFIYSYIIVACIALVKALGGGSDQLFLVVTELIYTGFLFKYVLISLIFAFLLPFLLPVLTFVYSKWSRWFHV